MKKSVLTNVGRRKVELTNLQKLLCLGAGIIKAEMVEYYLKVGPALLRHVKGRPLTFIRFPDGTDGESFFQKNTPDWSPDWIETVTLDDDSPNYLTPTEEASLIWSANQACIELHQIHSRNPKLHLPDYVVYDLEPPPGATFDDVVGIGFELKELLEQYGYHCFVKTTGKSGIHVVTPVETKWDEEAVFDAALAMATRFVEDNPKTATLQIRKNVRKTKFLIDVYRNRAAQTIVSPYSLRGVGCAPVTMPLSWDNLADLESPDDFNLRNVPEILSREGDAWEAMAAHAMPLHTVLKRRRSAKKPSGLKDYEGKRDFARTPEPRSGGAADKGNAFVIHRHHARQLHYDLRLQFEDALKSWALPKGLPPRPGIKRLAVSVEDHPLAYLSFEGKIPKGDDGAGEIWIFESGIYEVTKQKKDGSFYFRLYGSGWEGEFRMYNTKGNDWLIERLDTPQSDWLKDKLDPMLAKSADHPPTSTEYIYEVKWDGIRCVVTLEDGGLRIHTRNLRDVSDRFPEMITSSAFRASSGVFDGEIVVQDDSGRPDFSGVSSRLHSKRISRSPGPGQQVVCYLFDCMVLDGKPIVRKPLRRRRQWLEDAVKKNRFTG